MKSFQKVLLALLILLVMVPSAFAATKNYAQTRYPIVMIHGLTGAKSMVGLIEYWYGIPAKLKKNGNDQVFVATVSSFAGEDIRVAQIEKFIEDVLRQTGATKVNLIGHSQGGFTARGYAALHPDKVASITAVATPHHGAPAADLLVMLNTYVLQPLAPSVTDALVWLCETFGLINAGANGLKLEQDALGSLALLSSEGAEAFARNVHGAGLASTCDGRRATYHSGVMTNAAGQKVAWGYPMFSWTGSGAPPGIRSGLDLLDSSCYGLNAFRLVTKYVLGKGDNDGMVPVCSALFGDVIASNYYMSHMDEVNQVMGKVPIGTDPVMTYVTHANRLKNLGL